MSDLVVKCEGVNWKLDFPVITLKTNSGKTTFAVEESREFIEQQTGNPIEKVILITPYKRGRKQILQRKEWKKNKLVRALDIRDFKDRTFETSVIVSTYSGLCRAIENYGMSLDGCLLIFDEIHTFVDFTAYQYQMGYLLEWLDNPELWGRFYALGLSGTPQILFDYINPFGELPFEFKDITPNAPMNLQCGKGLFVNHGSAKSYAEMLIQKGFEGAKLFYVDNAKTCYELAQKFNDAGYQAAYIVSEYHDRHKDSRGVILGDAMKEQVFDGLSILGWIDDKSDVPPTLDVLCINAAVKDAINILDESGRFDEAIIESTNRATVEQARSRIRHDLECLTVVYNCASRENARFNLIDALDFIEELNSCGDDAERVKALGQRLANQYKSKIEDTPTKQINWVVAQGLEDMFLNPFIIPLCAYNLDNYEFSAERTHYDMETGFEIIERRTITRFGRILPSFKEWRDALKPMIGGKDFETVSGGQIREQVNNKPKIDDAFASGLLSLGKWYTSDELREVAATLELKNADSNVMGYEYLVSLLEQRYSVEHKKKQINKVRRWRYCFAEK